MTGHRQIEILHFAGLAVKEQLAVEVGICIHAEIDIVFIGAARHLELYLAAEALRNLRRTEIIERFGRRPFRIGADKLRVGIDNGKELVAVGYKSVKIRIGIDFSIFSCREVDFAVGIEISVLRIVCFCSEQIELIVPDGPGSVNHFVIVCENGLCFSGAECVSYNVTGIGRTIQEAVIRFLIEVKRDRVARQHVSFLVCCVEAAAVSIYSIPGNIQITNDIRIIVQPVDAAEFDFRPVCIFRNDEKRCILAFSVIVHAVKRIAVRKIELFAVSEYMREIFFLLLADFTHLCQTL